MLSVTPTLLIVPGLGDSGPQHWQTLWEHKFGAARVRQDDPQNPTPQAWAARLQETVEGVQDDVILVAHSCGVPTVAHWAALYDVPERVRGALLVAPPDILHPTLQAEYPTAEQMAPVPLSPLPFAALVVASDTDPYCTPEQAAAFARAWGAGFVSVGDAGHINTASGHGEWPEGERLLADFLETLE